MSDTTQNPQAIIDLILSDINGIIPNFSALVSSYRLLVGSAEEIQRTPNICPDVFERAVRRFDNTGTLIDILLELLCCKIAFSSEFLRLSCAPVDLFRLLATTKDACDTPHNTAEQVLGLEILRRALTRCTTTPPCLPEQPVICPTATADEPRSPKPAATCTANECLKMTELETTWLKDGPAGDEQAMASADCFRSHLRLKHLPLSAGQRPTNKTNATNSRSRRR